MSIIGQGAQTYRLRDAKVVFFGSQMDIKDWYILNVVTYALLKCLTSWNKGIIIFFFQIDVSMLNLLKTIVYKLHLYSESLLKLRPIKNTGLFLHQIQRSRSISNNNTSSTDKNG